VPAGSFTVTIYDVSGRAGSALEDRRDFPGERRVRLDAGALAPGVYLARATAGAGGRDLAAVRKLTVTR
jgi:hypothetical protein